MAIFKILTDRVGYGKVELVVSYANDGSNNSVYIKTQVTDDINANWVRMSSENFDAYITRLQFLQKWLNDPELRKEYPTL